MLENKFKKNKKIKISIIIGVILIIIAYFFIFSGKKKVEYVTAKVERGNLIQTVTETGTVKASKEIDLNFLQSGKINKIEVKVGNKVTKDTVLAELDYTQQSIEMKKAEAGVEGARANLSKVLNGATPQEIAVNQASLDQAQSSYDSSIKELERINRISDENISQAQKNYDDIISRTNNDLTTYEEAFTTAEVNLNNTKLSYQRYIDNYKASGLDTANAKLSAAKTSLDNINTILNDNDAKSTLSVKNSTYLDLTKNKYLDAINYISKTESDLLSAETDQTSDKIINSLDSVLILLNKTLLGLNDCYKVLENSIISSIFTQAELDLYKTNINTQITTINSAITATQTSKQNLSDSILNYNNNVNNAERSYSQAKTNLDNAVLSSKNTLTNAKLSASQQITQAQSRVSNSLTSLNLAKAQLIKIKSRASESDILYARSQVSQAEATLEEAKKRINDNIIKAPIDGIITKINYEIGEDTTQAKPVISMLGNNVFEIEVLISEADIIKVMKDNNAEITLDAYGNDVKFIGSVYFIEPAETIIQDVIYYKAKINFAAENYNIRSGMTANVTIKTAELENVLYIPSRAIIEKSDNTKVVRKFIKNKLTEIPITIGLRGDGGSVEILSGLNNGETIVTSIKNN